MKKLAILLAAVLLLCSLAGCGAAAKQPSPAEPQSFQVDILNNADITLHSIAISFSVNGNVLGSRAVQNADGSALKQGDVFGFGFLPEDFPDGLPESLTIAFYVGTAAGQDFTAADTIQIQAPAYGASYPVTLSGNTTDAFRITSEAPAVTVLTEPTSTPEPEPAAAEAPAEAPCFDLSGPWHLDSSRNDLAGFDAYYPGYSVSGASMELRSDGRLSWHIGEEGGSGSYRVEGSLLIAELTQAKDNAPITTEFDILQEGDSFYLAMHAPNGMTFWLWGDREDDPQFPGPNVAELVNLRGDTVTVYKLADGSYMDRVNMLYTFDGVDTWTDSNGVEWNETVA